MKKSLWVVLLLVIILPIGWWLLSPLWIDKEVNEEVPITAKQQQEEKNDEMSQEYKGVFVDGDKQHHTSGTVHTLTEGNQRFLRFENFDATNGPDLYVYITDSSNNIESGINLGKLKGNKGSQNYDLSKDIDLEKFNRVIIWCKAFNVTFGSADLQKKM